MKKRQDQGLDPEPFIQRLSAEDPFHREAAAWSLGEMGCRCAGRPLAGLLLAELRAVERDGVFENAGVVRAAAIAIRRLGADEALYALVKALCVLSHVDGVDRETVEEIVETISDVGGPNAMREAGDRVVRHLAACPDPQPGLQVVGSLLLDRLSLCGDAALFALRRVEAGGPPPLRLLARQALDAARTVNP